MKAALHIHYQDSEGQEKYHQSYVKERDTRFRCTRTATRGQAMHVIFRAPEEFIPAEKILTLANYTKNVGGATIKLNFPIPLLFGGRISSTFNTDFKSSIGFRFSVRNVPF